MGFEPTDALTSPVFKTGAFNHSAISPCENILDQTQNILPRRGGFVNRKETTENEKIFIFFKLGLAKGKKVWYYKQADLNSNCISGCGEVWYRA